jgi:hypothetical protein
VTDSRGATAVCALICAPVKTSTHAMENIAKQRRANLMQSPGKTLRTIRSVTYRMQFLHCGEHFAVSWCLHQHSGSDRDDWMAGGGDNNRALSRCSSAVRHAVRINRAARTGNCASETFCLLIGTTELQFEEAGYV